MDLLALLQAGNGMIGNGVERQKSRHRRVCMAVEGKRCERDSFVHEQANVIKG